MKLNFQDLIFVTRVFIQSIHSPCMFFHDFFTFQFQIQDLTRLSISIKLKLKWSTTTTFHVVVYQVIQFCIPHDLTLNQHLIRLSQSQYISCLMKSPSAFSLPVLLQIQLTVKSILFALILSLWINDINQHYRLLGRF